MMREFGKYSIISPIGTGGMAEVFLAKSYGAEGLEKRLVLKRILPEYAKRSKFVSMFIDEAKVAVSLNHPNIVQVYEFGKVDNDYYLAMEYVDGTDLGHVLSALRHREESLSLGEVAYIGVELAKALDYAHRKTDEHGRSMAIVHRDVSPQNVLLTWDGSVKLVDFGIAKAAHTTDERLGVVKGKISYMAPEQARGDAVDHRSDIFSLGAVLYEMLTNRPPFPRGKPENVLTLVRAGVIPEIGTLREDLPFVLRQIVTKAVARDPEDRFETARALQVALTRFLFSQKEIHDAGSLADVLTGVREELARRESQPLLPSERRTTLVTAEETPASTAGTLRETATLQRTERTPTAGTPGPLDIPFFRERRETFIVVGELLGLGELRTQLTDDRWRSILFDTIHLVQSVSFKNQCAVDRVDERGFLLLAGIPISSENDAETAVRVARDLIEAVDAMSINLIQPLRLSVGIAVGGLILERVRQDGDDRYNWTATEPSWDRARLLAKEAMSGEILVDDITRRRARKLYEVSELRDAEVEGLEMIHRVDRPKSHRQRLLEHRKSFTTLHGRDFELGLLRQAFQETKRKGTMRSLILLGDPGVGKASIVSEFLTGLRQDRVRVVQTSCAPDFSERPFAPVIGMLEHMLDLDHTSDIRARKRQIESRLNALLKGYDADERRLILHTVALLFHVKVTDNLIGALEPERRRARMLLSLRRLLGALALEGSGVVVINDVQWADPSSLEFFAEVVTARRARPILVVMTARVTTELLRSEAWRRLMEAPDLLVHTVRDLTPQSARALIHDLLDAPMEPALVEQIVDRSGGNPLFIKEILEHLQDEELLVPHNGVLTLGEQGAELQVPATVEGIVAGRIGSLPPGPKVVLLRTSLIGREADEGELRAVFGEVPQADLDALVERGVLARTEGGDGRVRYRFTKGLTRHVAAKALLEEEQAEIHAKLADHLIERESRLTEMDLGAVARHLEAAGETEDAGQYYLLAAANALDSSGLTEALALVDHALPLLVDSSELRFNALDLKEKLLKDLGRTEDRRAVLSELARFVDRYGPREQEIQLLIRSARYEFDMGHMAVAESSLRQVIELADEIGDRRGRASALAQLSGVWRNTGRTKQAREACEEALALYADIDDPEGAAIAWNQLGILHHQGGRLEEALVAYEKVVEQARRVGMKSLEEVARINMGFCLVKMGELERAVQTYRETLHEILRLGHRRNEAALLANLGHVQILLGESSRAEHTLRRCIRLSRRSSDSMRLADGLLTLATSQLSRGRLHDAAKSVASGLKAAIESQNVYLLCHGYLLSGEIKLQRHTPGDIESALSDAEQVLEAATTGPHLFALARGESLKARCFARMGQMVEAVEASHRAVGWLEQGAVEESEEVWFRHAQLLVEAGFEREACEAIERAHGLVEQKRSRIHSAKHQRLFSERRINQRIEELYRSLSGEREAK